MIDVTVFRIDVPPQVVPVSGHPDKAVIRVGRELSIYVTAADIDRLTCALTQAREVLSRAESKENR
ncbi:hypothetical protein [Asanoa iriomotensis]|uniref:Uncharacterized protein n=1 Tax=Asanoa iriomotensis TaxID=234613 RepID=A0ABQ4CFI7_9ACTN|nr:hypothetical protein [Asanoa iriomotensis]GIF61539.1 hypothetical protein Air01nite_76340 [Asanoa iriomotensis]